MTTPHASAGVVILVGIDFSEASEYALALAKNLVRPAGEHAELHVAHVMSMRTLPDAFADVIPSPNLGLSWVMDGARKRLVRMCLAAAEGVGTHVVPHVVLGNPVDELPLLAQDVRADLLVLGAHSRKGLARAFHSSLSARLTRSAPCCVLIARAKRPGPEASIEPPCPECVDARQKGDGRASWCELHAQRHVRPHSQQHFPESL